MNDVYVFDPGSREGPSTLARGVEQGLVELSDQSTPRLRESSESTWARNADVIFFWDRSGASESDPLVFFRYELGTAQPDVLSVIVPDDCESPEEVGTRSDVTAAFDRDTVAMTFTCDRTDGETGIVSFSGVDLFIMRVNGSTLEASQRIDLVAGTVLDCTSVEGCVPDVDPASAGEGFGVSFSPDGTEIAFTSASSTPDSNGDLPNRTLHVADLTTLQISDLETGLCGGNSKDLIPAVGLGILLDHQGASLCCSSHCSENVAGERALSDPTGRSTLYS